MTMRQMSYWMEKWVLSIFIFTIPFQTRIIIAQWHPVFNEWTSAFLYASDLLIFTLFALYLMRAKKCRLRPEIPWIALLVFFTLTTISVSVAINRPVAWYRVIKLLEYIGLFFYLRSAIGRVVSFAGLCKILVASALFQSLIGIAQFSFGHSLGLKLFGESYLDLVIHNVAVFFVGTVKYLRAYGTTPHPNILASWIIIGLWALWYLYGTEHPSKKYYLLIIQPFLLLGLMTAFSRTILAVYAVGAFGTMLWFIFQKMQRGRPLMDRIAPYKHLIAASLISILFFSVLLWPQLKARAVIDTHEEAFAHRVYFNGIAEGVIKRVPILGLGAGQFIPTLMKQLGRDDSYFYQPVHNIYLLISSETGAISLIVFLVFIFVVMLRVLRASDASNFLRHMVITILASLLFIGLFDHFLWSLNMGNLILWLSLGIAAALCRQQEETEQL